MAYINEETGKSLMIKEIQELAKKLKVNVGFSVSTDEMTYAELVACKQNLENQHAANEWREL